MPFFLLPYTVSSSFRLDENLDPSLALELRNELVGDPLALLVEEVLTDSAAHLSQRHRSGLTSIGHFDHVVPEFGFHDPADFPRLEGEGGLILQFVNAYGTEGAAASCSGTVADSIIADRSIAAAVYTTTPTTSHRTA